MSKIIRGIPASNGIAIAKTHYISHLPTHVEMVLNCDVTLEIEKLNRALEISQNEILTIREYTAFNLGKDEAEIFDAQFYMVQDPEMISSVIAMINQKKVNVSHAFKVVMDQIIDQLKNSADDYLRSRIIDLTDIKERVLRNLENQEPKAISQEIDQPVIIVTDDLTPSDAILLDKNLVKGIITATGGKTSHSAILARSLGIPAVVGVNSISNLALSQMIILDGDQGLILVDPNDDEINSYQKQLEITLSLKQQFQTLKDKPGVTKDNHVINIGANIGSISDVNDVLNQNLSIGLYRTEFLYMNASSIPDESWQYDAYLKVLEKMKDHDVVIRTLDVGGDKNLLYLAQEKELNPFLGHRGLRLSLTYFEMFKTQIRALLRANIYGNLFIMLPMVTTLDELSQAKAIINDVYCDLVNEGFEIKPYKVGIMIEVPSAALFADAFAKEVDFFSIGTNDLIQYLFAADRMNQKVSYLYQPYHPVVLQTIKNVVNAAHKNGIPVGVCGEMASHFKSALILIGLGIDQLSMSATIAPEIKYYLKLFTYQELVSIANHVLGLSSNHEVYQYISKLVVDKLAHL